MKNKRSRNFLDFVFKVREDLLWSVSDDGTVIVEMENKGFADRIAQIFFKRPVISHIALEGMGSFIFLQIDGKRSVLEIGSLTGKEFGDEAEPLYERLSVYLRKLEQVGFIKRVDNDPPGRGLRFILLKMDH